MTSLEWVMVTKEEMGEMIKRGLVMYHFWVVTPEQRERLKGFSLSKLPTGKVTSDMVKESLLEAFS